MKYLPQRLPSIDCCTIQPTGHVRPYANIPLSIGCFVISAFKLFMAILTHDCFLVCMTISVKMVLLEEKNKKC